MPSLNILVPNLGSTSLKFQLLRMPDETPLSKGKFERVTDYRATIRSIDTGGEPIHAVAFKAVHAGPDYRGTYVVDDALLNALERYLPAAPLHNQIYLTGIRAFAEAMPDVPMIAAFETEFHATMPEHAAAYGVPREWCHNYGIRKYGFHGASHQYVAERVPAILGKKPDFLRIVSCHLGGSSSMCAIVGGQSIDTTMGFSPQSGLQNATRHGDLDVFAVLYLMEQCGWTIHEAREQLAAQGGLAGISGIKGGDVRDLETAAASGNSDASLALDVFTYEVRKTIGAYAAAMGGIDAIAFTGGIGENSATLRERCCEGLDFLGVLLDPDRNRNKGSGDRVVSSDEARVSVVALSTNEEIIVARRAYRVLS